MRVCEFVWGVSISIHALLAESDPMISETVWLIIVFLSTLSLRRATSREYAKRCHPCISIHALLAESDHTRSKSLSYTLYFYPRSPCGERQFSFQPNNFNQYFYPRSPCGERRLWIMLYSCPGNFYPRSPCGERRQVNQTCREEISISIHALLAESDLM